MLLLVLGCAQHIPPGADLAALLPATPQALRVCRIETATGSLPADSHAADNDLQIQRLWALHRADPDLVILPAHDGRQWEIAFPNGACIE